jgi:RNA polymerase primary sigma factor
MTDDKRHYRGTDEVGRLRRQADGRRLLSAKDEVRLAKRIERGDVAAKDEMIESNLRLVFAVARGYRGRGVPFEDLVQEGTVGLVRAVELFDHRRGLKLSTYAVWWIRRSMANAIGAERVIRIPAGASQQLAAILRADRELRARGGGAPSIEAVAGRAGLSVRAVRALRDAPRVTASLDEVVGDDETALGELLGDPDSVDAFTRIDDQETRGRLWSMLRVLPGRHREVLLRHYGLAGTQPQSHEEIGRWLGVGEERSRQIERQALHWLREQGGGGQLAA